MKIDVSQSVPNMRLAIRAALERLSLGAAGQNSTMENRVHAAAPPGSSLPGNNAVSLSPSLRDTKPLSAATAPPRNQEVKP